MPGSPPRPSSRHAALVSASIHVKGCAGGEIGPETTPGRRSWRKPQPRRQIEPCRCLALEQIDLPLPVPALELPFASNSGLHVLEEFVPDEMMDRILFGEAVNGANAVLVEPGDQIGRDSDVNRTVGATGENVDARLLHRRRACGEMDAETSSA